LGGSRFYSEGQLPCHIRKRPKDGNLTRKDRAISGSLGEKKH
jgi:hypothetical protein